MDLKLIGKPGAPEVLLLSGAEALQPLAKKYCLLLPVFGEENTPQERLAALERALIREHGGRVRGLYALGEDAALALRLLHHGNVRVRVTVLEGAFALPEELSAPLPGPVHYWFRKKDKAAQRTRDALKNLAAPLSTVAMKKLPKGMALMDRRPDMALKRLEKAFGGGVTVTCSAMLPGSAESAWREICLSPAGGETLLLTHIEPIRCEDADHVQILEGSSKHLPLWSHLIRLESADRDLTFRTDQIELDAGRLNALAKPLAALYLKEQQLRRRLAGSLRRHALS